MVSRLRRYQGGVWDGRGLRRLRLGASSLVVVAVLMLSVGAATAFAWQVNRVDFKTFEIVREPSDAHTAETITIYRTGSSAAFSSSHASAGTLDETSTGGLFNGATAYTVSMDANSHRLTFLGTDNSILVVVNGEKHLMLYPGIIPVQTYGGDGAIITTANPAPVRLYGSNLVTSTVTYMPPVALDSSISVSGTLPVDPWGTAGMPDNWVIILSLFGVGALAIALAKGFAHERYK